MEILAVDRGANRDVCDRVVDVVDLHLDVRIARQPGLSDTPLGGVDHPLGGGVVEGLDVPRPHLSRSPPSSIATERSLRQLWMQGSLHPLGIALEPPLEVVE